MSYNNSVLVGNWNEERLKNERENLKDHDVGYAMQTEVPYDSSKNNRYEFKLFLRKRDRHELLLQRSRTLFSNLLKERPLAISGTYVLFGFNVQVCATDMPVKGQAKGAKPRYGLALSSLVMERQVDYVQNICDGCLMTLSPITTPCCRNTFVILSTKGDTSRGEKMNYGDEFLLKAENYGEPEAAPLYVRFTPEGAPGPADRMPIQLSDNLDSCCRWTTVPLLPCDRLEGLGSPIKSCNSLGCRGDVAITSLNSEMYVCRSQTSTKLIIKNCVADKNLCVMNQSWMQTFFGPECGVTCRNYIDIHKRSTAENIFALVSDVETKTKE